MPAAPTKLEPRYFRLAGAAASCAAQAAAYGKCISQNFDNVGRDTCRSEFALFKDCVQKSLKRKW